jgi:putative transposase
MKNAYKSELDPNNKQVTVMRQHVGAARWAYNWGIERIKQAAAEGEKWPSAVDLHREVNKFKRTDALPWGYEVSKCAFQESLRNLQAAVDNLRASKQGKRKGAQMGFSKRKTRKRGLGSCRFTGTIKVFDDSIQLPRIGVVRLKEHGYLPSDKRITQATISERAGRWFVSVLVEEETLASQPTGGVAESVSSKATGEVLGVDVGIKTLATCSDGTCYANPKALAAKTKQLRRWQRRLSRRVRGGKNRTKARAKVARLHMQVANVRRDAYNKAARTIVDKRPSVLVIEDLNVKGLVKNRRLSRALSDAALGQFGRILSYMAEDAGVTVLKAGRFFASSKTCACCGWKHAHLTLSDQVFVCEECGHTMDRDLNAAINLKNTVSSTEIDACGDRVSPGDIAQVVVGETGTWQQMSPGEMFV